MKFTVWSCECHMTLCFHDIVDEYRRTVLVLAVNAYEAQKLAGIYMSKDGKYGKGHRKVRVETERHGEIELDAPEPIVSEDAEAGVLRSVRAA